MVKEIIVDDIESWRLAIRLAQSEKRLIRLNELDAPIFFKAEEEKFINEVSIKIENNDEAKRLVPLAREYCNIVETREKDLSENTNLIKLENAIQEYLQCLLGGIEGEEINPGFDNEEVLKSWKNFCFSLETNKKSDAVSSIFELLLIIKNEIIYLQFQNLPVVRVRNSNIEC